MSPPPAKGGTDPRGFWGPPALGSVNSELHGELIRDTVKDTAPTPSRSSPRTSSPPGTLLQNKSVGRMPFFKLAPLCLCCGPQGTSSEPSPSAQHRVQPQPVHQQLRRGHGQQGVQDMRWERHHLPVRNGSGVLPRHLPHQPHGAQDHPVRGCPLTKPTLSSAPSSPLEWDQKNLQAAVEGMKRENVREPWEQDVSGTIVWCSESEHVKDLLASEGP